MKILNTLSESILRFIIGNVNNSNKINHDAIFEHFNTLSRNKIIAVLEELESNEYIKYITDDNYEMGLVVLRNSGMLYFDNKETETPSTTNVINYGNFNNSVIGNNNSVII